MLIIIYVIITCVIIIVIILGLFGGGKLNLNQIQKGGRLSARRTKKSINEFLNSSVTSSQILNMVNKQRHTKIKGKKSCNRLTKKRVRARKM